MLYISSFLIIVFVLLFFRRIALYNPFFIVSTSLLVLVLPGIHLGGIYYLYEIDDDVKYFITFGVSFFLFGGFFCKLMVSLSPRIGQPSEDYQSYPRDFQYNFTKKIYRSAILLGLATTLMLYLSFDQIPLFSDDPHFSRIYELHGKGVPYKLSLSLIYIGLAYLSWRVFYLRSTKKSELIYLSSICFIVLLGYANRFDSAFCIFIPTIFWLSKKNINLILASMIAVPALGILFFLVAVLQLARHQGLDGLISASLSEIVNFSFPVMLHRFWVQAENIQYVMNNIPPASMFMETYFQDIKMIIPWMGVSETAGVLLKSKIGLEFMGGGITPTFIGEAYVNFGYLGSMMISFVFGFFCYLFGFFVSHKVKTKDIYTPILMLGSIMTFGFAGGTVFAVIGHYHIPLLIASTLLFLCFFVFDAVKRTALKT